MKRLDRYILTSMFRVIATSVLLVSGVLLMFDIFSNLERYMSYSVSYAQIGRLTFLYLPAAIGLAVGPAALFATTYFLSMLHANNEMIILSNIGYPFRRIIAPIIVLGIALVCFQFFFSEQVAIPASREKARLSKEVFGERQLGDNRNVTLQSPEGRYVLHAGRYYESEQRITSVILVVLDEQGRLNARIDATSGSFNGTYWVFRDVRKYLLDLDGIVLHASREDEYHNEGITMEPALFRNLSADITTMELQSALRYVQRIKLMDSNQYALYASDLANRVFGNLTPLILIIISCSTVFTWRKNVLVLSILASLAIAVVFFVLQMVSMIFAKQGIYAPELGPLAPIAVLALVSVVIQITRRI